METLPRSQSFEVLALCRDETVFVRLCNALLLAVAARRYGESGFRPEFTERTKAKDEGIDGLIDVFSGGDEPSGGLIGPGLSAYQFKFSSERATSSLAGSLQKDLTLQRPKIWARNPLLKRYIVLTNQDLGPSSGKRRRQIEDGLRETFGPMGVEYAAFGAAELAAWLAGYPAVALSFGASPVFELNHDRNRRLLRPSALLGAPESFVGRETELDSLRRYISGPPGGTLVVAGPPRIGKSRLVTKAIESESAAAGRAYWLLRPGSDLRERFRVLQLQRGAIAVIDELVTRDEGRHCLDVALEFPDVKTILIAREEVAPSAQDAQVIHVARLSFDAETELIDLLGLKDHRLKDWLRQQGQGNPGVILEFAAAARDLEEGLTDEEVLRAIHDRLYTTFIPDVETARVAAWFALRHYVDLDSLTDSDHRLAGVLGVDYSDAGHLNERAMLLADRGLVARTGSRIRFEAPFLLPGLIERRLFPTGDRLPEALARLSTDAWAQLFAVLEPLRDRKDVLEVAGEMLASPLFDSVEKLFGKAELFVSCGRITPTRAAATALELFRVASTHLGPLLGSQPSWKVLDFLRACLYELGAEEVAFAALIEASLADDDGQMPGRRVDERYLLGLWSRLHWADVGLPLSRRGELLRELARHEDPRRRRLAASAGGAAFSPFYVEMMSPRSSQVLPETGRSALTWLDIGAYYEGVMSELLQLSGDGDALVAEKAQSAVLHGFRSILVPVVSPEAIKTVIDRLVNQAEKNMSDRAAVRAEFKAAIEDLGELRGRGFDDWQGRVVTMFDQALQEKLDPETGFVDFETEVRDVFGNRLGGPEDTLWGWRLGAGGAPPPSTPLQQRALRIVEKIAQEPQTLAPSLLEFLASKEATFAWLFWRLLGQSDCSRRWSNMLARASNCAGFADYMAGWSEISPGEADEFLDRCLEGETQGRDDAVFGATWKQEPTERRARRIAEILHRGQVPRRSAAGWLAIGWLAHLSEPAALDVLHVLAEEPEGSGAPELVDAVYGLFTGSQADRSEVTRNFAWSVLTDAASREEAASGDPMRREFFSLAAKLVELGDHEKGFALFERLMRKPAKLFEGRIESLVLSELGAALVKVDRPRLVRAVLAHVVEHRDSFPGGMPVAETLLNPEVDRDQILMAIGSEPGSARAVLTLFTGEEPHFLELVAAILETVPQSEDLWYELVYRYAHARVIMGSSAEHAKRMVDGLQAFAVRHQPLGPPVKAWLEYAQKALGRRHAVAEQWEFVRGFWDGKGTAEEAVALLDRPSNDPDRRWFVRRLLENEKKGLVRRILRDEEIRAALEEDSELSPRARGEWEVLLKRGVATWKS